MKTVGGLSKLVGPEVSTHKSRTDLLTDVSKRGENLKLDKLR